MVKDAGLACRFVISKKPQGCPVTERLDFAVFCLSDCYKDYCKGCGYKIFMTFWE